MKLHFFNLDSKFYLVLKITVSIGLIFLVSKNIDFGESLNYFYQFNFKYFIVILVALSIQMIIATIRWAKVNAYLELNLNLNLLLKYMWIACFFSQILPSNIGGDAMKGYYLYQEGFAIKKSIFGILLDRFLGMLGLVILIIFLMPITLNTIDETFIQLPLFFIIFGLLILILTIFFIDFLPEKFTRLKFINAIYEMASIGRSILFNVKKGGFLILVSILIQLLSVLVIKLISLGMGVDINWNLILMVFPLVALFTALPISIGGWGVREGIMVGGLGYLGVANEISLAISIMYGISAFIITLPGLLLWLFYKKTTTD